MVKNTDWQIYSWNIQMCNFIDVDWWSMFIYWTSCVYTGALLYLNATDPSVMLWPTPATGFLLGKRVYSLNFFFYFLQKGPFCCPPCSCWCRPCGWCRRPCGRWCSGETCRSTARWRSSSAPSATWCPTSWTQSRRPSSSWDWEPGYDLDGW